LSVGREQDKIQGSRHFVIRQTCDFSKTNCQYQPLICDWYCYSS